MVNLVALVHECETFLTNDQRLKAADQIRVVTLRELAGRNIGED